ncbi:phosphoglucosamine mutase [Bryobacterales bacterium F-183]|nr:phosphoglucosamine mutase [Bryobacterales bacterium F-183]
MPRREHQLKIGVSGIRGVVGEFLTPLLTREFAQAFGTYVGAGRVVVGRDTRATGPMLQHAVHCGLLASGCEVIDVGVLPTPTIQMFAGATKARGGIALTASHNPPEYNALKLFNNRGLFFNHYERNELLDIFHESSFRQASFDEMRPLRCDYDAPARMHISRVLKLVDVDRIRTRGFKVALDAVNGAGSVMTPGFLTENLGCKLDAIAIDPTKPFPREAEPKPETLGDLAELVRRSGSAIGFAQDPDGDRLAVCDENGNILDNDDVFGLCLDAVLLRTPGNVVVNLMTSAVVDDIAAQHGCRVYRSPVGEANVVEFMQAANAVVGGEGSNGGLILPAVHHCRDSYTAMALLLDRMAATGLPVSELAARLPRYYRFMDKVAFEHGKLGPMMQALEALYPNATLDRSDGLKLLLDDAWVHVRSSNTEPLLRLAIEAKSPERLAEIRAAAEKVLR